MWMCQVLRTDEGTQGLRIDQWVFGKASHWCPEKKWFHAELGTDASQEISQKYGEFRKKKLYSGVENCGAVERVELVSQWIGFVSTCLCRCRQAITKGRE